MSDEKNKNYVYFDNAATTKPDDAVIREMMNYYSDEYGNPSSLHKMGLSAQKAIENSRKIIADSLNTETKNIFFTSGSTESINTVILSYCRLNKNKGTHIITTKIEHKAVLNTFKVLEKEGFTASYLDVDEKGFISLDDLKEKINEQLNINNKTILVSICHANNEIGTVQDIKSIGAVCKENDVFFHSDTTQSYTKIKIDVDELNIDSCCISAHKFHGPKGIGAMYVRNPKSILPLIFGGGQEFNLRSGTQNVPAIVGMGKASKLAFVNFKSSVKHMEDLSSYLTSKLLSIPNSLLNGPKISDDGRLCNNVNISFDFIEGESMVMYLDMDGVACSTGSACSSNTLRPSHVLEAIGANHERVHGTLRFSVSRYNNFNECDYVYGKVKDVVEKLRAMSPLTK